ncbi:MAG: hypothetical protein Tsb0010_01010 [Parvularculaceae bacterium]
MSSGAKADGVDGVKRRLLKGAAAAPLVVSFYGGRAWAVSNSCGSTIQDYQVEELGEAYDNLDSKKKRKRRRAKATIEQYEDKGIGYSCLASATSASAERLDDLTRPKV